MAGAMRTKKELNSMKVADLREELRSSGLKVSGVKQELVDRLATHLKSSKSRLSANVLPPAPVMVAASKPHSIGVSRASEFRASESIETIAPVHTIKALPEPSVDTMQQHMPTAAVLADISVQNVQSQIEIALTEACIDARDTVGAGTLAERMFAEPPSAPLLASQEHENPTVNQPHASCALVEDTVRKEAALGAVVTSQAPQMPSLIVASETFLETLPLPRDRSICHPTPPKTTQGEIEASAEPEGCNSRPPRPRRVSRVPLSPTATLAPEVGGTPSKDGDTPLKCQTAWREICAKEAACLRIRFKPSTEEAAHGSSYPESSSQGSPDSQGESSSEESIAATGVRARSPLSRSRSPYASPQGKQSEPSPTVSEQVELATRPKVILKKRRSLLPKDVPTNSTFQWRRSGSRSRSPIQRRQGTPKNCLFSCSASTYQGTPPRPAQATPSSKGAAEVCATPDQLRARARAQELRAELLKRRDQANSVCSGSAAGTLQDASDFSWSRPANTTPRAPLASLVSGSLATPAASPLQAPTEAAASVPRNLCWTLQDAVASTSDKGQGGDGKQHMLEQLTQQMQLCLARLREPQLDDTRREKYQELASSIQSQVDKLTSIRFLSSPGPMGPRRLLSSP